LNRNSTTFRQGPTSADTGARLAGLIAGQPAAEHFDPLVEGVEVGVMTSSHEVDPVSLWPAPDQCVLVGVAEHALLREDRERRNPQSLPLTPARLVHCLDCAPHDRGVETRDEAVIRRLEVRHPGVDDHPITEEVASGGFILERHWPGRKIPAKTGGLGGIIVPRNVTFQHDEALDQVWSPSCHEKRGVGSHRLPDERDSPPWYELFDHRHDVTDESVTGQVIGKPRARTVPSLIHEQDPMVLQRLRRAQ